MAGDVPDEPRQLARDRRHDLRRVLAGSGQAAELRTQAGLRLPGDGPDVIRQYLYRAIDSVGNTVEFWFSEQRDLLSAKRFFRKALACHGRPESVVIDGSQTNHEAIVSCDTTYRLQDRSRRRLKPIRIRKSKYLNNRIEQDHRRIKRCIRPMLGSQSPASAAIILSGIEMIHMMRKRQARYAFNPNLSWVEQFAILAA